MNKKFNYNFATKEIVGSKAAIEKANKGIEPEYSELTRMMKAQPSFTVVEKTIRQNEAKKTYHALTIERMGEYISLQADSAAKMVEFSAIQKVAKAKGALYPLTKKWFLAKYPEYKENSVSNSEAETASVAA